MHHASRLVTNAAALRLPVFPCRWDKRPCIGRTEGGQGFKDASTDLADIERMFGHRGAELIGVPTGEASGWDVLDLDYRSGAKVFELTNQHRLPETRIHETQSGGRHLVFLHAPGVRNSASSIAPGVDVRGSGGYVIVPPSPGYRIISDAEPCHWPDWLLEMVLPKPVPAVPRPAAGPRQPVSSKRLNRFIEIALDKVRAAPDGAKHFTLRNQAILLGGLQHLAGFSDGEAIRWLLDALPDSVQDMQVAEDTARWGVENGRRRPVELDDRPDYVSPRSNGHAEPQDHDGWARADEEPPAEEDGYLDSLGTPVEPAEQPEPSTKQRRRAKPDAGAQQAEASDDPRPIIKVLAGKLDRLATEAERVLKGSGLPVFQRGSALVRPVTYEVPASRGRTTVSAGLASMVQASMIDTYAQIAQWVRYDARSKAWLATDPPAMVASVHLSRAGSWTVPPVAGVITTPTLRPDGSVLLEPGYDAATRLYYVPDPTLRLPALADRPTRKDAEEAIRLLVALLASFPFVSPVALSVALSMLITPIVRGALSVAPLHAAKASTAGTGKSYLVDLASAIGTGRPCPVAAAAQNPEETEKRLVGLLLSAFPIVSIDNVNGELGGDVLCQAVERPLIRVRPLGRSDIIEIESRACIYATGNNLRVAGDMVRRSLVTTLDAGVERPELRQFNSDPVAEVLADRGRYVAACLTIVRAYRAAGNPARLRALASFEDWSDLVRSALVWLGHADPCASMEEAREDDPELTELREVMVAWHEAFASEPRTIRRAIEAATAPTVQANEDGDVPTHGAAMTLPYPDLRDIFIRLSSGRGALDTTRIGKWMVAHEGRIVSIAGISSGLRFMRDGKTDGVVRWKLSSVRG